MKTGEFYIQNVAIMALEVSVRSHAERWPYFQPFYRPVSESLLLSVVLRDESVMLAG